MRASIVAIVIGMAVPPSVVLAGEVQDAAIRIAPLLARAPAADAAFDAMRREINGDAPADPGAAQRLRHAEAWGNAAARGGWEWRVAYGLADAEDLRLARLVASECIRVSGACEVMIERALEADASVRAAAVRADAVLPLQSARAMLLLASCAETPVATRELVDAAGGLLMSMPDAGDWFERERALLTARALTLSGNGAGALEIARSLGQDAGVEGLLVRVGAEALVNGPAGARGVLRGAIDDASLVPDGERDWFASITAAGMHARLAIDEARGLTGDAPARDAARSQALAMFDRLSHQATTDGEAALVLSEAARALAIDPALAQTDFGAVAAAVRAPDEFGDTARLARVVDGGSLAPRVRPAGELALLRALAARGDEVSKLDAARRAVRFADSHPDDERRNATLSWGVSLLWTITGRDEQVAEVLRAALAAESDHPDTDAWRSLLAGSLSRLAGSAELARAGALIDEAIGALSGRTDAKNDHFAASLLVWMGERTEDEGGAGRGWFERGLESARGISGDGARRVRARALVGLGRDAAAVAEMNGVADRGDACAAVCIAFVRVGRADESPISACDETQRGLFSSRLHRAAWAHTRGMIDRFPEDARRDRLRPEWVDGAWGVIAEVGTLAPGEAAWGLLIAGEGELASRFFETAMARDGRAAWLVRGHAESLLAVGDDAGAFGAFRELALLSEADKSRRDYWHAQARLAEILAAQNEDGSRTDTIARLIRRLREEPGWGAFADCAERLERVALTVGAGD